MMHEHDWEAIGVENIRCRMCGTRPDSYEQVTLPGSITRHYRQRADTETLCGRPTTGYHVAGDITRWSLELCDWCIRNRAWREHGEPSA